MLHLLIYSIIILTGLGLASGRICEVCDDNSCSGKMVRCNKNNSDIPFMQKANEISEADVEFGCLDLEYSLRNKCTNKVRRIMRKCVVLLDNYSICAHIESQVEVYKCVMNESGHYGGIEAASYTDRSSITGSNSLTFSGSSILLSTLSSSFSTFSSEEVHISPSYSDSSHSTSESDGGSTVSSSSETNQGLNALSSSVSTVNLEFQSKSNSVPHKDFNSKSDLPSSFLMDSTTLSNSILSSSHSYESPLYTSSRPISYTTASVSLIDEDSPMQSNVASSREPISSSERDIIPTTFIFNLPPSSSYEIPTSTDLTPGSSNVYLSQSISDTTISVSSADGNFSMHDNLVTLSPVASVFSQPDFVSNTEPSISSDIDLTPLFDVIPKSASGTYSSGSTSKSDSSSSNIHRTSTHMVSSYPIETGTGINSDYSFHESSNSIASSVPASANFEVTVTSNKKTSLSNMNMSPSSNKDSTSSLDIDRIVTNPTSTNSISGTTENYKFSSNEVSTSTVRSYVSSSYTRVNITTISSNKDQTSSSVVHLISSSKIDSTSPSIIDKFATSTSNSITILSEIFNSPNETMPISKSDPTNSSDLYPTPSFETHGPSTRTDSSPSTQGVISSIEKSSVDTRNSFPSSTPLSQILLNDDSISPFNKDMISSTNTDHSVVSSVSSSPSNLYQMSLAPLSDTNPTTVFDAAISSSYFELPSIDHSSNKDQATYIPIKSSDSSKELSLDENSHLTRVVPTLSLRSTIFPSTYSSMVPDDEVVASEQTVPFTIPLTSIYSTSSTTSDGTSLSVKLKIACRLEFVLLFFIFMISFC